MASSAYRWHVAVDGGVDFQSVGIKVIRPAGGVVEMLFAPGQHLAAKHLPEIGRLPVVCDPHSES